MADPRFFKSNGPFKLSELATLISAEIRGGDGDLVVDDVASLKDAEASHISFLDNVKYKDDFLNTQACACIVSPKMAEIAPEGITLLVSDAPYKSYALIAQYFYPINVDLSSESSFIHPNAHVSDKAVIGAGSQIKAGAVIECGAVIGKSVCIEANAVISENVEIGDGSVVGANASISHAVIGCHVRIYPGARIGQDGFGFAIDPAGHVKVPQLGRVIVEDSVEIGANTTIDRGAGPDTVIGQGSWLDNLVQIGHNVKIGRGCIIIAQAGVAGSTVLEDYAVIAAQVGVAGHLTIGMGARIGAQSGVMRDVAPGSELLGTPALPAKQFMRQVAMMKKMINKQKT